MLDVVTLGESMVLLVPTSAGPLRHATHFERHLAGAESNVAIGVARLGGRAGWISRVGDDEFGRYALATIRGEGVDVSRVVVDPAAPTGVFFRERRELGPVRTYYYRRGSAASRLSPDDVPAEYLSAARYLHVTGITPALSAACAAAVRHAVDVARAAGVVVTFDPNYRQRLWPAIEAKPVLLDLAARCDVLLPGLDEAQILTGETSAEAAGERLLALGPRLVVVKLAAEGCLAVSGEGAVAAPALPLRRVVDPVGAGDAFAAGFLVGQIRGWDLPRTLRLANLMGAYATTVPGDVEGLPTWQEIETFGGVDVVR
ncbi:MAG: sugar kinase [Chloroflexi bacterium]|nr:sugar kinase [Chloroflexota bacterium]